MKDKLLIEIATFYAPEDKDFGGDYGRIKLRVTNDTTGYVIFEQEYGDWYHDKGGAKVEAVVEFIEKTYREEFKITKIETNLNEVW